MFVFLKRRFLNFFKIIVFKQKAGNNSYLVRPSEQSMGDFTLFFNADNTIHRFRITRKQYESEIKSSKENSPESLSSSSSLVSTCNDENPNNCFQIGGRYFKR